jgi:dGTPase
MNIRESLEERERRDLSPFAALSSESCGRLRPEHGHSCRTAFQRDRDRIIHSKAFRRLKHKTQVFLSPTGDHYRTRLTHALEVSQIARTIARCLRLNEDLVEAISLAHDIGHTPFGHAGESVLNNLYDPGFSHNEQGLRVVDKLDGEPGRGLNLTMEVRDGILHHSKGASILEPGRHGPAATVEAEVVRVSDGIAYINHDIDDACRAGIISLDELPEAAVSVVGRNHSERIDAMVKSVIGNSTEGKMRMSADILKATDELRDFLYAKVYPRRDVQAEVDKAKHLLEDIYRYLIERPDFPIPEALADEPKERHVVDFVAGMTDRYAVAFYEQRFLPEPWRL